MESLRLTKQAEVDIHHIWEHIGVECGSPTAAEKQVERVFHRLRLLATRPELGEQRDDLRSGIRTFAAGNYVILYILAGVGIEVIGVVHGAQDWEGIVRRRE